MMLRNFFVLLLALVMPHTVCSTPVEENSIVRDYNSMDVFFLALNIYHEARGERIECQFLISAITLNRVNDSRWPNTVKEVVLSPRQFSWTNGKVPIVKNEKAWTLSLQVAKASLDGFTDGMTDSFWYHTHEVNPSWNKFMIPAEICDNHVFWMDGI